MPVATFFNEYLWNNLERHLFVNLALQSPLLEKYLPIIEAIHKFVENWR